MFRVMVLILIIGNAAGSNGDLSDDGEKEEEKRDDLEIKLSKFLTENNLQAGHYALTKVLADMEKIVQVEKDHPLETYSIHYQKIIQKELEKKMETMFEDQALYISQEFHDLYKKLDKQDKDNRIRLKIQELRMKDDKDTDTIIILKEVSQYLRTGFSDKLDDLYIKISSKIDEKFRNIQKFEDLNQTISDMGTDLSNEIRNVTQILKKQIKKEMCRTGPSDCYDILKMGNSKSGVYEIYLQGDSFNVFCDMESNGGGWTVFLNRQKQKSQLNFTQNWKSYKNGFGDPPNEYWLGNEALHRMTTSMDYSLRIDAEGDLLPRTIWGEWSTFRVHSEKEKYQLTLTGHNANSTLANDPNGFHYNNGKYFSTIDRDNDKNSKTDCAKDNLYGRGGGFWYGWCSQNFPTRPYGKIYFWRWSVTDTARKGNIASTLTMKIRPRI